MSKKSWKSELENPVASSVRVMYAHEFPKDSQYRTPLEPFIGMKITIQGTYDKFELKGSEECEETYMLLKKVSVVESPRLSGRYKHEEIDHMWIMIPDDYVVRNKIRKGDILFCKGKLYEYAKRIGNNPVRNIGMNLIKSKRRKTEEQNETTITPTFVVQAKRKLTIEQYETEIAMQIEEIIRSQNITNFAELTALLHEYPVMYEVVMKNPEYFRIIIEANAKGSKDKPIVITEPEKPKPVEAKKHIIEAGAVFYDLETAKGKTEYKNHLQKIVERYAVDNPSVLAKPKDKIYVIGDGQAMLGIQDKNSKNYCSAKKMDTFLNAHKFIDICCYDVSGNFKFRHMEMYE